MCGIAGLYTKSAAVRGELGAHLAAMLEQLALRGPDSAGAALYRAPAPDGSCKVSLHDVGGAPDWPAVTELLAERFPRAPHARPFGSRCRDGQPGEVNRPPGIDPRLVETAAVARIRP
jgi:hypothetical protein